MSKHKSLVVPGKFLSRVGLLKCLAISALDKTFPGTTTVLPPDPDLGYQMLSESNKFNYGSKVSSFKN